MCKHEEKKCPRCRSGFECKPGNVLQCQCYGIDLTIEAKDFIEGRYNDCLCSACLYELCDANFAQRGAN